ncbi:hypothetical protein [Lewinella cohaerens]|uniref:hypothetical protein n=1 Tax=Lewinella cohaerens TaxID=70995 RepID=UPI00036C11F4|nr:hypothetical protein [Lewinella cohaerens]
MENILNFLSENKEWLFSGIGVFVIAGIVNFFFKKPKKSSKPDYKQAVNLIPGDNRNDNEDIILDGLKNRIKILFIDDDTKFSNVSMLKTAGWKQTKTIKDVKSYDERNVVEADIIFVDIHGVGKALSCPDEGLGLAKNIKLKYPDKKVVIYSAEQRGDRFHKALKIVDDTLRKDADPFEFQNLVEEFSREIYEK